jgi:predicted negative regulator of RcsB-dependent stress response
MEKSCKDIERMLVDYADNQLSQIDANKVAKHLVECKECRKLLDALQKSLELAGVIWADNLAETENIRIPATKTRKIHRSRYTAIAAGILLVVAVSVVWHTRTRPKVDELTFAEVERKINESGSAAELLAATELLAGQPDEQAFVQQQYRYIVERYPQTSSAVKAKAKLQ